VGRTCGTHGRGEKSVQGFGGKVQRKRPLRRLRHRWEDGIRMDLGEIGWGNMEWIHLAEDRDWCQALVNMNILSGNGVTLEEHEPELNSSDVTFFKRYRDFIRRSDNRR
jgi:hypothetical protein